MKEAKTGKIEIETDRLIIRTPEDKDVHDIFVLMSDREIAASTGFRPMNTLSEAEGKIRREMDGGLMFCISEKQGDGWRTNVLYFGKEPSGKGSRCF